MKQWETQYFVNWCLLTPPCKEITPHIISTADYYNNYDYDNDTENDEDNYDYVSAMMLMFKLILLLVLHYCCNSC